jgi:DNA (cytosine-5)-methyltransferase 1
VLEARFPGIPNAGDVTRLASLPAADLLTAGFPCQDLSQAGKTAGIDGRKSGLVDEVFRLIDQNRPRWVLLENVSFMLRLDRGSAMERLVSAFEERKYRWAYRVVNSLSFLSQRRERVFFLASLEGDPADILLVDDVEPLPSNTTLDSHAHGFYWTEGTRGLGWGPDCVPTLKNGSTIGIPSPPAILLPNGEIVTPDIDAERLQGFRPGWTKPAQRTGRASFRWSLVGNAVTKPVAGWIGKRLRTPGKYDRSRDVTPLAAGDWPRAARLDGATRREVRISPFPTWRRRKPLHEFLQYEPQLLSARATAGFLSRIDKSSLRFVPGFKDRVRAHLNHVSAIDRFVGGKRTTLIAAE